MTDDINASCTRVPREDISDLLARLYREIGISAVAAALEVTAPKLATKGEDADKPVSAADPEGKTLAA